MGLFGAIIMGVFIFVIANSVLFIIFRSINKENNKKKELCTLKINATIVDNSVNYSYSSAGNDYYSTVILKYKYNYQGKEYIQDSYNGFIKSKKYKKGDTIEVFIDPNNPSYSIIKDYEDKQFKLRLIICEIILLIISIIPIIFM